MDEELELAPEFAQAEKDYPPIKVDRLNVHIFPLDGKWQVWLNVAGGLEFNGLSVSYCETRDQAVAEAVRVFEAVVEVLQGLPPAEKE